MSIQLCVARSPDSTGDPSTRKARVLRHAVNTTHKSCPWRGSTNKIKIRNQSYCLQLHPVIQERHNDAASTAACCGQRMLRNLCTKCVSEHTLENFRTPPIIARACKQMWRVQRLFRSLCGGRTDLDAWWTPLLQRCTTKVRSWQETLPQPKELKLFLQRFLLRT